MVGPGLFFIFMLLALPAVRDGRMWLMAMPLVISIIINFTGALA